MPNPQESIMNEKTKQRLESELNVPAPTQPVDKLRLAESPAAEAPLTALIRAVECACGAAPPMSCFADDE